MSNLTTVARPYARAAFEYAFEHESISEWSTMLSFSALVADDATVKKMIESDKAPTYLANFFISICGDQLSLNGQNFIKSLAKNGRLSVLPRIAELFLTLEKEQEKAIDVNVTSAYVLNKQQIIKLTDSLEKGFNLKVNLNFSIDKSIIAGMVVTAGEFIIDSSVKTQLSRLSTALLS